MKKLKLMDIKEQVKRRIGNIKVGDTFTPRSKKYNNIYTVKDFIIHTKLSTNEVVSVEVVASHKLMGQEILSNHLTTTVHMAKIREN